MENRHSPSYTNLTDWDASQAKRRICFPYEYVRNITSKAIDHAFDDWDSWDEPQLSYLKPEVWIEPDPNHWWIEGFNGCMH